MKHYLLSILLLTNLTGNQPKFHQAEPLNAPWRTEYVLDKLQKKVPQPNTKCPFCNQLSDKNDEKNYIVKRFNHCALFLNLYPYSIGHLLIVVNRHVGQLHLLSKEERTEIMELINLCTQYFEKVLHTPHINIGINLGKAAGAGIPEHLHVHLVPRNFGDTGFLQTIANLWLVDINLGKLCEKIKKDFEKINLENPQFA